MGDTVKEIGTVLEDVTNTTDIPSSIFTLLGWFQALLQHISTSSNPAATAAQHAAVLAENKEALATAVTANT